MSEITALNCPYGGLHRHSDQCKDSKGRRRCGKKKHTRHGKKCFRVMRSG